MTLFNSYFKVGVTHSKDNASPVLLCINTCSFKDLCDATDNGIDLPISDPKLYLNLGFEIGGLKLGNLPGINVMLMKMLMMLVMIM